MDKIKANELRIGNKVLFASEGTEFTVVDITKGGLGVEDEIESTWIEIDQFEGIPLTEEWLVKFGFERKNYSDDTVNDYWIHKDMFPDHYVYYLPYKNLSIYVGSLTIEYVHQLQNLYFSLTGNELQIL